jgi:hypothetical protein
MGPTAPGRLLTPSGIPETAVYEQLATNAAGALAKPEHPALRTDRRHRRQLSRAAEAGRAGLAFLAEGVAGQMNEQHRRCLRVDADEADLRRGVPGSLAAAGSGTRTSRIARSSWRARNQRRNPPTPRPSRGGQLLRALQSCNLSCGQSCAVVTDGAVGRHEGVVHAPLILGAIRKRGVRICLTAVRAAG